MINGPWESVPSECIEKWRTIFAENREGFDLSTSCPICHNMELHRFYQIGRRPKSPVDSGQYTAKGSEWQWCSYCRVFEHEEVLVPDWWVPNLEIDGRKLTAIPEILDMAFRNEEKVNKWNCVPDQFLETWNKVFSENACKTIIEDNCPICTGRSLRQYYTLDMPGQMKYKRKFYKGKGAHWEWCATCFHYRFSCLAPVPLDWNCELSIDTWNLMVIPEPINEKMRLNGCI